MGGRAGSTSGKSLGGMAGRTAGPAKGSAGTTDGDIREGANGGMLGVKAGAIMGAI